VPLRYGIRQTVGDSVGPGGVLRALRQVPELVAIGRDVEDLAPQAWMINYANPLTANVRAISGWAHERVIGLCHGTMHSAIEIAGALELPRSAIDVEFAGLNHLCWLLSVKRSQGPGAGEDLYPELRSRVRSAVQSSAPSPLAAPVAADLLDLFGLYPVPGDRHVAEFFGWYLAADEANGELPWQLQPGLDATIGYINEKTDLWDKLHEQADGRIPLDEVQAGQEAERLVSISESLITGHEIAELAVNLPNGRLIPNLPPHAVVEVPAAIGANSIKGIATGPLPDGIAAVLSSRVNQQEITVRAALSASAELAVQALALDPLVSDTRTARAILTDAIEAHRPWLDYLERPDTVPGSARSALTTEPGPARAAGG
jgi:alpha-galactosidase